MPITDVIFLGAGASAADGAPLQKDLIRKYFQPNQPPLRSESGPIADRLWGFFQDFFGIDTCTNVADPFPTFEEALGVLELALSRGEVFRDSGQLVLQRT